MPLADAEEILRELRQLAAEIERQKGTVAKAIAVAEQMTAKIESTLKPPPPAPRVSPRTRTAGRG